MALVYDDLLGHHDKVQEAINRLQTFEPPNEPMYVAFSGGKDSQAIYHLCKLAGVKFDAHYAVTTVDPPPLVKFVKEHYPDVSREMAHYDKDVYRNGRLLRKAGEPVTMWKLIVDRQMPPTRKARFCCAVLKEPNGKGRVTVTGVRWEESINRKRTHGLVDLQGAVKQTEKVAAEVGAETKNNGRGTLILNNDNDASRQVVEHCFQKAKTTINPIIDWTEDDVWEFLNDVVKVPHCELYDQGWNRLGCIGCPMASVEERRRSFEEWPKYKDAYIRAFQRMIDEKSETAGVQYSQRLEHEDEASLTPPRKQHWENGHFRFSPTEAGGICSPGTMDAGRDTGESSATSTPPNGIPGAIREIGAERYLRLWSSGQLFNEIRERARI